MSSPNADASYREDVQSDIVTNERPEYEQEMLDGPHVFGLHGEGLSMPTRAWRLSRFLTDGQFQDPKQIQYLKEQITQNVCHAGAHFRPFQEGDYPYATNIYEARDEGYPHGMQLVASQQATLARNMGNLHDTSSTAANTRKMQDGHVFAQPGENHTHQSQYNNKLLGSTPIGTTNAISSHQRGFLTGHKHTSLRHHRLPYMASSLLNIHTSLENVSFTPSSSIETAYPYGRPFSSIPLTTPTTRFTQYTSPVSTAYNTPKLSKDSTDSKGATNITTTPSFPHAQPHGPMRLCAELSHTHPGVHTKCQMQLERWAYETYDLNMTIAERLERSNWTC